MIVTFSSLGLGLIVGYLGQRSRMCSIGGLRDFVLVRDTGLLKGAGALTFIVDYVLRHSPPAFLLFAVSDGTLALLTLWVLLTARAIAPVRPYRHKPQRRDFPGSLRRATRIL